jgi:hypothetical protein
LFCIAAATPAIPETRHQEDFCNSLKVVGTGTIEIANSVVDRRLALEYYNVMNGEGDIEMVTTNQVSNVRIPGKLNGSTAPLNLYETTRMTYSGATPLVGSKYLNSRAFYGGMGSVVQENFAVTEMDKEQTAFFASTAPANPSEGRSLAHLVGMDTKTSFNGTWQTDASWHKIFYKDVKVHEAFSGQFEVEKLVKFHESSVAEPVVSPCSGFDC